MTLKKLTLPLVALLIVLNCNSGSAQYPVGSGAGVVHGSGNHVVKRMPEAARINLAVSAKGKTLEEALANLKKRTDAIREQVPKLGGKADSIKFSPANKTDSTQQQQMLETLRQQLGGERVPKGLAAPTSVTVNSMLTADWPLAADSADKLLIEADKLQKKITDADLAGLKAAEKEQTPEEREMAEEMETMVRNQYGGNIAIPKPGTPNLSYIATLPEADRDAAMAEAFKKARTDAERLAKAAGVQLGALAHVTGTSNSGASTASAVFNPYPGAFNSPYSAYGVTESMPSAEANENESVSNMPAEVEFRFIVSVGYAAAGK